VLHDHGLETGDLFALFALFAAVASRGWVWRLASGPAYPRSWAGVVVPAFGAEPWAEAWGTDPIEALTVALAETLTDPPPAR